MRHKCYSATQSFVYYMTQEVIEPEFQKLEANVKKVGVQVLSLLQFDLMGSMSSARLQL